MDFLGYVRVRVDRSKPLSEVPEVYLDRATLKGEKCPGDAIGELYLRGLEFVFQPDSFDFPVANCVSGKGG